MQRTVRDRIVEKKMEVINKFWNADYLVIGKNLLYALEVEITDLRAEYATIPKPLNLKTGDKYLSMTVIVVDVPNFLEITGDGYS
jgi:hypothetical protein